MAQTVRRVYPVPLLVALIIAVALMIDLGDIHQHHQSDSLIPILTSLYHWTPYYWEENRFGMLVPLLAMPIKHPLANLLFQDALLIAAGLSVFFLLPRAVLRGFAWPIVGIASAAAFLALAPVHFQFRFLIEQCYGPSLALGLGGLILAERAPHGGFSKWKLPLALALLLLAHWVNIGVVLVLGPLLVLRFLFFSRPRTKKAELAVALLLLSGGFLVGFIGMKLSPFEATSTSLGSIPFTQWPGGWAQFASHTWGGLNPPYWQIALFVAAEVSLLVVFFSRGWRRYVGRAARAAAVLAVVGLFYGVFAGTREWVQRSGFADRYAIPAVILVQAALATLTVIPFSRVLRRHSTKAFVCLAPLLVLSAAYSYGGPSLSRIRADLDRNLGKRTPEVLEGRCTHIAGDYWEIWTTVFHANLDRYERGESSILWGISYRAPPPTLASPRQVPDEELRVAIPINDREAPKYFDAFHFPPLEKWEKHRTIKILIHKNARDGTEVISSVSRPFSWPPRLSLKAF